MHGGGKCRDFAKVALWANIAINLAILGFFKYFNFFVESATSLLALCGLNLNTATLQIILPVGISFYTFQALSYSIDVYKGKIEATRDAVAFFAYVSFFPQLVAGPIERATNLLPQFLKQREFDYATAVDGCRQMLWGFFKKVVIADNCAIVANQIFSGYETFDASVLLVGALYFTFQIYGDFSGYSDIAIGCGKLFGVKLMRNFNVPYFSRDIAEFWRRWHISLTTWFRDYIYIPLGGSRCSKAKIVRNTFVIFLVSGLWHGANWTFVAWGAYHALFFLPLILLGKNRKHTDIVADGRLFPSLKELLQMLATFALVVVGWIIFRAETISEAWSYISRLCSLEIWRAGYRFFLFPMNKGSLWVVVLILFEWINRREEHGLSISYMHKPIRISIYYILTVLILIYLGQPQEFIYFQF